MRFYGAGPRSGAVPLVVHLHGGAFVSGGGDDEGGSVVPRLIAQAGALVVSIDYPLAPAHPFPEALDSGHDAVHWAFRHRARLVGEGAPVFVAGEEAGGNLAAAVAMMVRDRHEPWLAGQILLSPMLNPLLATASLRAVDAGIKGCRWADGWQQYLPRPRDAGHPYAAPGLSARLTGLAAALVLTADDDPLRDESLDYARRLKGAGVDVHQAVLPAPTRWPLSYQFEDSLQAPWALAVKRAIHRFLQSSPLPFSGTAD